jgi:hypothetical protein
MQNKFLLTLCLLLACGAAIAEPQVKNDNKDLEQLLNNFQSEHKDLIKKLKENPNLMQDQLKDISKVDLNSQLKSMQNISPTKLFTELISSNDDGSPEIDYSRIISDMLVSFRNQNPKELETLIKSTFSNGKVGSYINNSPKLITFMRKSLQDKTALPKIAKMYERKNKKRIKIFFGIFIGTFLASFILKRFMGAIKRFFVIWGVRLTSFLVLFGEFFSRMFKLALESL